MVMPQCYGVIKYTLVFVNLIFWALGLIALVLGIWMLVDHTFMVSLAQEQENYHAGLYIMIAAGALMLIVSFVGCCGAFRESQCMLVTFFSCLLVVVVAQIAAGAWLYANRGRLDSLVKTAFTNTIKNEYGQIDYRTQTVDAIQSGLGCCGANGPGDWASSKYGGQIGFDVLSLSVSTSITEYKVPKSCCKAQELCENDPKLRVADAIDRNIYSEGCVDKVRMVLSKQACVILLTIIAVGFVEFIGLLFSLCLCCAIGSSDRYKA